MNRIQKTLLVSLALASASAVAGPAPRSSEKFIHDAVEEASSSGTVVEVPEELREALRRIGKGEPLPPEQSLLRQQAAVRPRTGLETFRNREIEAPAGEAFDAMRRFPEPTYLREPPRVTPEAVDELYAAYEDSIAASVGAEELRYAEAAAKFALGQVLGRDGSSEVMSLRLAPPASPATGAGRFVTVARYQVEVVLASGERLSYLVGVDPLGRAGLL